MEILRSEGGSRFWTCRRRLNSLRASYFIGQLLSSAKSKSWEVLSFLVLAPLQRARAAVQSVARGTTEEIDPFEDWTLQETPAFLPSSKKLKASSRRQKGLPTRKRSELSTVTSTPRLDTDEEEDSELWLRDLVLTIVSGLHTDTEDFVLVGKRKKRVEIPPKRKNARKRRTEERAREPSPPLLVKQTGRVYPVNSTLRLHSDLVDFQASVGENLETSSVVRLLLTEKIQRLTRSRFPGAKAEVYGSFATQLALPSSDLDLVILHRRIQGRETAQKAVETLASTISRQGFAKNIQVFESAAVPLVRFQAECGYFNGTGDLKVDISFDSRRPGWTHSGLVAAQYVRELIAVRPGLRSLVLALKQVLTMYGLNCAYTGGLSSYALLIWTAAYIGEAHCSDFGQMLSGFLAFYGNEFDPLTTGISLSPR